MIIFGFYIAIQLQRQKNKNFIVFRLRSLGRVSNSIVCRGVFATSCLRVMIENTQNFEISLFDGKTNFMIQQSTIQNLLVHQGLDLALEDEKSIVVGEREWAQIQRKVESTIRLVFAPEIKCNVLKETIPIALWEKLESIYASKSLTNHLCQKMKVLTMKVLYQLCNALREGGIIHGDNKMGKKEY